MSPPSKKQLSKGFYGFENDDAQFLRPDGAAGTDPFKADGHSTVGYNARFDDSAGTLNYEGHGVDGADDCEAFCRPSIHRTSESDGRVHQDLSYLIDNEYDQGSGNKLTGGGGPVSKNPTPGDDGGQWRGSGRKGPKYKNPPPASFQSNNRKPR